MKMFARIALLGFCLFWKAVLAQSLPMRTVCTLPSVLGESSGLICTGPNSLWSHNDSGGQPKLYQIDTLGNLLRTVVLRGVPNVDWEEITQDSAGNVYVGDFGNNDNNRGNLVIYKIANPDLAPSDTLDVQAIRFNYPDQNAFPPADSMRYFDMEAMVALGDSLYLFSKNRTDPFDGLTKCYSLPQDSGNYVANLRDSIITCTSNLANCWATAAALRPDGKQLLLLAYGKVFVFSCFEGSNFFGGAMVSRNITFSQTEAISWKDSSHVFMTDELLNGIFGGKLYELDLAELVAEPQADLGADTTINMGDSLVIGPISQPGFAYNWSTGAQASQITIGTAGSYALTVTAANGCQQSDTMQLSTVVGLEVGNSQQLFQLWPNPSQSEFHLLPNVKLEENARILVIDALGRTVLQKEIKGEMTFGAEWPRGLYWLEVVAGENRQIAKLLRN